MARLFIFLCFVSTCVRAAPVTEMSSINDLRAALRSNAADAAQAANALAQRGSAARPALTELIEALRFDEESITAPVSAALLAIGPEAIPPLTSGLRDPNFFVRKRSAMILGKFGAKAKSASRQLAPLVLDPSYPVTEAAVTALRQIGPDALPSLIATFDSQDDRGQLVLLNVIGGMGPPAFPFLLRNLNKNESIYVRVKVCEVLGAIRPTSAEAVGGLTEALSQGDERLRLSAVNGLAALGNQVKAALGPLIVTSQTDSDPLVRQKALQTLSGVGSATAVSLPGLGRALHSSQVEVRLAAVNAIASCTDDPSHAAALLQAALRDPDAGVQARAKAALAQLQTAAPPALSTGPVRH